ncbi:MAG: ATP-binding protein [Candidatus Nanopelagicales bacterium]
MPTTSAGLDSKVVLVPGVIAVVGGECSGKSTLAHALAAELDAVLVVEELRKFVDEVGRAPLVHEQAAVMARQIAAETAAVDVASELGKAWVVGDPGALMTAVYSVAYFDDDSLLPAALEHQGAYSWTLWCDIDLPWQADGVQRDGPHERQRVHDVIEELVARYSLDIVRIRGSASERVEYVRRLLT